MPKITASADMTRTREALAAFDALDAKVDAEGNYEALAELFGQIDDAKLAIGEAFALDTADRNPDHKQTAQWAAFSPAKVREVVAQIEAA